jgi:hypothetical protein
MIESDDYKKGWYDGYQAAKKEQGINIPSIPPLTTPKIADNRCSVCGINFGNGAWGYVCTNSKCPTGFSSGAFGKTGDELLHRRCRPIDKNKYG